MGHLIKYMLDGAWSMGNEVKEDSEPYILNK